jgi:hypothetical protein
LFFFEISFGGWPIFDFPRLVPPQLRLPHLSWFSKGARDAAESEAILTLMERAEHQHGYFWLLDAQYPGKVSAGTIF